MSIPQFIRQIIEVIAFEARASEYVDQKSGVSARMTRSALEMLIANAERRAALYGKSRVSVRVSDLYCVESAITGKLELVYEGEQEGPQKVARLLTGKAVRKVFAEYFPDPNQKGKEREAYNAILDWFAKGKTLTLDPELSDTEFRKQLAAVSGLDKLISRHLSAAEKPPVARKDAWILKEFILEGLHQSSMLGKDEQTYSDMMGSMLGSLDLGEEEGDFE